jgi:hypothetical protein
MLQSSTLAHQITGLARVLDRFHQSCFEIVIGGGGEGSRGEVIRAAAG